ncbi:LOW QUALITY PROTEIN: hypothetical protein CVT25_011954 [Psilocybe cyanescens]|uniref:Uncharacterized protein n=1 Tax=Psilocybe cyanescens TaxID=93625 RepID=A0A409XJY9_PSICY|nr:LOW QUALITY PROTEIN: hypothetical protein CVT25_011954 [Psilocybe cyanescens]
MALEQMHASRAEQSKQRLIEAETEQAAEEAEASHFRSLPRYHAIKFYVEQRQLLMQPFATVKVEFADLDGLRSSHGLLLPVNDNVNSIAHTTTNSNSDTFIVFTNADLASFSADDTIRISSSSSSSRLPFPPSMFTPSPFLPSPIRGPHPAGSTRLRGETPETHDNDNDNDEDRRARFASRRAVSAFFHLEFGVTATPPFSPAPTPAPPASGFHLRSGSALNVDAAPDSDAGAALNDANANSDEEEEEEDALSLSLLLPPPPPAPSLRECRSPAITLTPSPYAHMVASAASSPVVVLIGCPELCDLTVGGGVGAGARACQHGHGHGYGHKEDEPSRSSFNTSHSSHYGNNDSNNDGGGGGGGGGGEALHTSIIGSFPVCPTTTTASTSTSTTSRSRSYSHSHSRSSISRYHAYPDANSHPHSHSYYHSSASPYKNNNYHEDRDEEDDQADDDCCSIDEDGYDDVRVHVYTIEPEPECKSKSKGGFGNNGGGGYPRLALRHTEREHEGVEEQ